MHEELYHSLTIECVTATTVILTVNGLGTLSEINT